MLVSPLLDASRVPPPWLDDLARCGVAIEPAVTRRRAYVTQLRMLTRLVAARRPSVVHTHGYQADVIAGYAARRAGIPVVTTVHGFVRGDWKNRVYETLQRRTFRRFDAVMPVSRAMADELRRAGVPGERLHTVPNAFDAQAEPMSRAVARRELGLEDGPFHIGWMGRFSHEKALDVMLRALAVAPVVDARLSVLGDGRDGRRLRRLAQRLGIDQRVVWHGVRASAGRLVSAFDLVVLSSRSEGTPLVLLEAMAAGIPVIASRVGGVPDVVTDKEALLVPPDDPAALAAALATVRSDPERAATRAAAARRRLAEEFNTGRWLARIEEVYAAAAGTGSDPGRR